MPKVRFNETVTTRQLVPQTFEAGKVYDLPSDAVARWQVRGKVEAVVEGEDEKPKADDKPKKTGK